MKSDIKQIGFSLDRITTEQFAIIEKEVVEDIQIGISSQLRFAFNDQKKKKVLIVFALFRFEQNKNPFLIIEIACHFKILEYTYESFKNKEKNTISFPKNFISHLTVLTIGTLRGALHSKTENTRYNNFFLPTINVDELIKSGVTIPISNRNIDKPIK